jgi:uncharacterized protein
MSIVTIIMLIIVGLAAGILSGLIGIGGGIIIVPALVLVVGFSQKEAQGTSLGILLLPVGILAVIQYYKQGYVNLGYVAIIALTFVIGGYLGSKLALSMDEGKVKKIFAVTMMVIAIKMLFFDNSKPKKLDTSGISTMEKKSE